MCACVRVLCVRETHADCRFRQLSSLHFAKHGRCWRRLACSMQGPYHHPVTDVCDGVFTCMIVHVWLFDAAEVYMDGSSIAKRPTELIYLYSPQHRRGAFCPPIARA